MTPEFTTAMIRRLIVVLDESTASERALSVALRYAERLGATVELLGLTAEHVGACQLRDRLADLVRQCGPPVESSSVSVGDDDRDAAGRRLAADPQAAVVIGAHGRRLLDHDPTTRLVDQLLSEDVPVLVVTPHMGAPAPDLPVAACIDSSIESRRSIDAAARWARMLDVPLVVVRVTQPGLEPPVVPDALAEHAPDDVAEQVAAVVAEVSARWPDLDVHGRIVEYRWAVADALALHFSRHPAQLVAVATHPTTWWRRLVHTGVTSHLVDELPVPVVVTLASGPAPSGDAALPTSNVEPIHERPFETVINPVDPRQPTPAATRVAEALARAAGASVVTVRVDGRAAEVTDAILRAAARGAPSVVCLATTPPTALMDTLAPTITGSTLRWSHDAVVLVGPRCDAVGARFSEVAACVDGSQASDAVVDLAARWAEAFATPLRVIEVVDPSSTVPGAPGGPARLVDRLTARIARRRGVEASASVIEADDAAIALRDWSEEHPDSLLVMASHGHGLSPHPLGRTVQFVVRHAPVPIAVVPRGATALT